MSKTPFISESAPITPAAWEALKQRTDPLGDWNRCRDFDEDCADIGCKLTCWLHDPEQGWCPYLREAPPVR